MEPNRAFTRFTNPLIELTWTSFFRTSNEIERVHLLVIELEPPTFGFKWSNFEQIYFNPSLLFSTMTKSSFFIELKHLHYYSTLSAISQFQSVSKNLGCNLLFHWNPICLVMSEQLSWQAFRDLLKLLCSII